MVNRELDAVCYAGSGALLAVCMQPYADLLGGVGDAMAAVFTSPLGVAAWGVPGWLFDEAYGALFPRAARNALFRRFRWFAGTWLGSVACDLLGDRGGWMGHQIGAPLHITLGYGAYGLVGTGLYALVRSCFPHAVDAVASSMVARARETVHALQRDYQTARLQLAAERRVMQLAASNTAPRTRPTPSRPSPRPAPRFDHSAQIIDVPCEVVDNCPTFSNLEYVAAAYRVPSVSVLAPSAGMEQPSQRDMQSDVRGIARVLGDYQIGYIAPRTSPRIGPVVLSYAVEIRPGVPLAKLEARAAEISHELGRPVRVVGSTVEVPRAERQTIALRPLLERALREQTSAVLPVMLGVGVTGESVSLDLARAPHVLIAGTTGSGKSVAINVMLCSLLLSKTPNELQLILIDPKRVELSSYRDLPHLLAPVATETGDAVSVLSWCVSEMERRYTALEQARSKSIEALGLPRIVVVIDEYADLSAQSDDVEDLTVRLAQKARAAGIHLVIATQHPIAKVVTSVLKNNVPARVCCRVANDSASRVVLDEGGADALLGMGDSLCILPGQTQPERVHGAYVSDDDVKAVCDAWRAQGTPQYAELSADRDSYADTAADSRRDKAPARDEDYDRALDYARTAGAVSIPALRKALGIGPQKATRIIERMDREGLLGPRRSPTTPRDFIG